MRTWLKWTLGLGAAAIGVVALRVTVAFFHRDAAVLPAVPTHGADAFGDPLPEGAAARIGTIRWRARWPAVWAPDGEHVVAGGWDDELLGMNVRTGRVDWTLPGHAGKLVHDTELRDLEWIVRTGELPTTTDCLAGMTLMPGGHRLLTQGYSHRVWDLDTRTEVVRIPLRGGGTWPAAVSRDGTLSAFPWGDRIRVVALEGGERRRRIELGADADCVAFDADGSRILAGLRDGRVAIVRLSGGPPVFVPVSDCGINALLVPGDGRAFWALDARGVVNVRSLASPDEPPRRVGGAAAAATAHWGGGMVPSPDGRTIAVWWSSEPIRFLDAATADAVPGPTSEPGAVVGWSPDGRTFATQTDGGVLRFFGDGAPAPLEAPARMIAAVAFSPDGRRVAVCDGRTLRIADAATGTVVAKFVADTEIRSAAWTTDGGAVVLGVAGPRIVAVDGATATLRWTYDVDPAGKPVPWSIRIAPDAAGATWIGGDGALRVLDLRGDRSAAAVVATGTADPTHLAHSNRLSANLRRLAALQFVPRPQPDSPNNVQCTLRLWDAGSTDPRAEVEAPGNSSLALSRDGQFAAAGDGGMTVFDLSAVPPREVGRLRWNVRDRVFSQSGDAMAAFSPDASRLAVGDVDGVVHVFALPSCAEVATLRGHRAGILCVAFSPDGRSLVSGSVDMTALVWDLRSVPAPPAVPAPK